MIIYSDPIALQEHIQTWAQNQPAIRAILVVGSQARRDRPADHWSDLDLQAFVTDIDLYLANLAWLGALGTMWVSIQYQDPGGEPEVLTLFEGGQKVDFHFFPVAELNRMVDEQALDKIYQRGYSILLDKDGLTEDLLTPTYAGPTLEKPSRLSFHQNIEFFWYGAAQVSKLIRRRDLWFVKNGDWRLKNCLLQLIEWHARAQNGWDYDTWYAGKFIDEWTDEHTRNALNQVFGHYNTADSWRSLLATISLYRQLANETATLLGYPYPSEMDANISGYIGDLYTQDQLED